MGLATVPALAGGEFRPQARGAQIHQPQIHQRWRRSHPARELAQQDASGNLPFAVDFRDLCATVLERWWGDAPGALNGRFAVFDIVRT